MIVYQAQVAFLTCLLLLCLQQAAGVSKSELRTSPEMHEKCGAYTYLRIKPFLKEIEELKLAIQEKDNQLNLLNDENIALQSTIRIDKQQILTCSESNTKDNNVQTIMDELMKTKTELKALEELAQATTLSTHKIISLCTRQHSCKVK